MNQLQVTLLSSDNTYLTYPCKGMLELFEIGMSGTIITGIFRGFKDEEKGHNWFDKSKGLNCPVVVKNPTFTYGK